MLIDFSGYTLDELHQAQHLLGLELEKRREHERAHLMEEFAALARARGFVLSDVVRPISGKEIGPRGTVKKGTRRPVAVKYRHPRDKSLTWTGRGKQPVWVKQWLGAGYSLAELAT